MAANPFLADVTAVFAPRYRVEKEIGHGGAGRVYLARDVQTGERVAIKVLREDLTAAVARDRFEREIAVTSHLEHPNILRILTWGEIDGLLYYVTPYVEGETLRQRLLRERQLAIEDAVRIAREISLALAAAHEQGVVHRDIKPENVLLSDERAIVADFGIARAITAAAGERLTSTGIAIGTPGYMSPEQASGERELDHRTDIYSLGSVVYEMLTGEPPYTGPSTLSIFAKQVALPTPSIRTVRKTVSEALDQAVQRALAKVPADRFATVDDFTAALTSAAPEVHWSRRSRAALLAALGVLVILAGIGVRLSLLRPGRGAASALDDLRFLVLPTERSGAVPAWYAGSQPLHDALLRWTGISVVDTRAVEDALGRSGGPASAAAALDLARRFGAGRIVRAAVSPIGDSIRLNVRLYDASAGGSQSSEHTTRAAAADTLQLQPFALAIDHLLFEGEPPADAPSAATTRSFPASRAYEEGRRAFEEWNLPRADSAFASAAALDAEFAQTQLQLAIVRSFRGMPAPAWRSFAERADLAGDRLEARERGLAAAALSEANGEWDHACGLWRQASVETPNDFVVWYGLARCLANDNAVRPDPSSPSGWSFRTSYQAALRAYQRAFALQPAILASFRPRSFEWLRHLFKTGGYELRGGRSTSPDTVMFLAHARWIGDTLAYVPYPRDGPRPTAPVGDEAVRRLREMFHDAAVTWVTSRPQSAAAHEALAISLAMLGDPSALATLQRARTLATDDADRFHIANDEVWMQLAFALPQDLTGVLRVRRLADSLLANPTTNSAADLMSLASLAALTGRADAAATYAVASERIRMQGEPLELRQSAPALLVYAAMGGPVDSLVQLEPRVRATIEDALPRERRPMARETWIVHAATLSFPDYRFRSTTGASEGDPILRLQAAFDSGDTAAVRRDLVAQHRLRLGVPPENLTLDGLLPQADLWLRLGAPDSAAAWLDPTLRTLSAKPPDALARPEQAACLVRTMALRARIALRSHDRLAASRWARAVVILWSDADPALQPFVARLRPAM